MAKFEKRGRGNFDKVLDVLNDTILNSISASIEEASEITINNTKVCVRAYERYSFLGKNRVSLTLTLVGNDDDLFLTMMTTGGSQAVFFKVNTFGESNFLNPLISVANELIK